MMFLGNSSVIPILKGAASGDLELEVCKFAHSEYPRITSCSTSYITDRDVF
jgi:hypothetical protein